MPRQQRGASLEYHIKYYVKNGQYEQAEELRERLFSLDKNKDKTSCSALD
jgi:hypothetical protein